VCACVIPEDGNSSLAGVTILLGVQLNSFRFFA